MRHAPHRILPRRQGQPGVQPRHGILEPPSQDHFIVTLALGPRPVGPDDIVALDAVSESSQLLQQGQLDGGFGQKGHQRDSLGTV
ncbi:MAG: hypothetical protein HKUEN07_34130 [Rhodocyclaceae bacterium]|nr:MAG: hypothetical protein HKUEN07_34130 [Rhodocyclaceae bacterium]